MTKKEIKDLQSKAEQHILRAEYKEAIEIYDIILENIRPNTQRWNRFRDAQLDCKIADALDPLDLRQTLNDIVSGKIN